MFPSARLRQKENVIPDSQAFEDSCIIVWAVCIILLLFKAGKEGNLCYW